MNDLIPIDDPQEERANKCTALEKQQRMDEVVDMMCKFHSSHEIQKFLMEKYGLAKKSTEPYLTQAKQIIISNKYPPQFLIDQIRLFAS